jgi:Ni2+-binding GTPase involved in maturation of urease and hydrogenase
MDIKIIQALDEYSVAYVKVDFGTPQDARRIAAKLKNHWIHDK